MSVELEHAHELSPKLSPRERLELESVLDESGPDAELEVAWLLEAKRRLEDIDAGREATLPAEEVLRNLRERSARARLARGG